VKQIAKLALTGLAGFAFGAGAIQGLHAQGGKKPGYVIAEVQITDQAPFDAYGKKAAETLKAANAHVLVRGKGEAKEGAPPQGTVYVIAFDSLADAEKWYSQPPYQPLIAEREKAAKSRVFMVEGLPQQ
jgi:uncharacterized protein (DUF1330 family)